MCFKAVVQAQVFMANLKRGAAEAKILFNICDVGGKLLSFSFAARIREMVTWFTKFSRKS